MKPKTYLIKKIDTILQIGKKSKGGRNFLGRICIYNRSMLHKRKYRFIDFFRRLNLWGYILYKIYDSNRSAFLGCIVYTNGLLSYFIVGHATPSNIFVFSGSKLLNIAKIPLSSTNTLKNIPLFTLISMVELKPFTGSQLCRAAGTKCLFIGKKNKAAIVKLASKWQVKVPLNSMAMFGQVSNILHKFQSVGKAGKQRALGFRPKVRGVAKNPCDHPHGGGNGKKSHPKVPVTM
jgi:large subunit ribosomal protein L2